MLTYRIANSLFFCKGPKTKENICLIYFVLDFRMHAHQYSYLNIMILYKQYVLQALITFAMMFIFACEKDPEQHLELGNWYLQKGLIDDAITEYREVSRLLPPDHSKLDRGQFKILGIAHFKLALSYTKKGW